MTIPELRNNFIINLHTSYPKEEIVSFFYLLAEHRMNLKRVDIALNSATNISNKDKDYFLNAIEKLKQEIPIQYIIGSTEFYGLPFYVDKNVLIPRPETEELVSLILQNTKAKSKKPKTKILDIGTGSGCIAISLAKNLSTAEVWALDVSKKALLVAKKNAESNKVNIQFLNDDILNISVLPINFDIIVSNPPYVRELEKKEIKNNVLQNEPHLALFVKNENPLLFYDRIADLAKKYLTKNGQLFFEINQYLVRETIALLKNKGFQNIELKKDIFEKDRMIKAVVK